MVTEDDERCVDPEVPGVVGPAALAGAKSVTMQSDETPVPDWVLKHQVAPAPVPLEAPEPESVPPPYCPACLGQHGERTAVVIVQGTHYCSEHGREAFVALEESRHVVRQDVLRQRLRQPDIALQEATTPPRPPKESHARQDH